MKTNLDWAVEDAEELAVSFRSSTEKALGSGSRAMGVTGLSTGLGQIRDMFGSDKTGASEQYRHFKGWAYVAIKAIAQRVASQPLLLTGFGPNAGGPQVAEEDAVEGRLNAPVWTKSHGDMSAGDVIEQHPLLDAVMRPNEMMTQWALMYVTVSSLELTGCAYWWFDDSDGELRIWPLPTHWVTPVHDEKEGLYHTYKIKPKGSADDEFVVPGANIAYFPLPDPSNPMSHISPLQTQAEAVATDEAIQESQFRAFKNGIFPGVMMTVGRLPDMPGGGPGERPVLEPEQRKVLVDAAKLFYQGAVNYNEPLVIDGMIEKIEKFSSSPSEMDFVNSGNVVKQRIFQAFGVNPLVLGEVSAGSYAQSSMADKHFVSTVINPILDLMGQVITSWMVPFFPSSEKIVAYFEPAQADDDDRRLKTWAEAIHAGAVTPNEIRSTLLQLPPSDDPAGDVLLIAGAGNAEAAQGSVAGGGGLPASISDVVDEFVQSAYSEPPVDHYAPEE